MGRNSRIRTFASVEKWAGVFLGALILAGAVIGVYPANARDPGVASTAIGENRLIELTDGSKLHLNTDTLLEWSFDAKERRVTLRSGESYFDVTRDPVRPFRVMVAQSELQVLGTRFDARVKPDGAVAVTVLEGVVRAAAQGDGGWQRTLEANDHLEVDGQGVIKEARMRSTSNVVRWREGKAVFDGVPLPMVVEELQRYTDRTIVIGDVRLNHLQFLGVLGVVDIPATLRQLAKMLPITIEEAGNTLTLRYRP